MKRAALLLLFLLPALAAHAQLKTGGLGGSGLNRRPAAPMVPGAPGASVTPGVSTQQSMPPPANGVAANGILLEAGWDKRVTGPARAANRDMADLRLCLAQYGKPAADLELHPDAQVFPGVAYLTPLKTAEAAIAKQVGGGFGLAGEFTIATEGFPLGLRFRKYDRGSLGIGANTHVYLLVDGANRVISTAFTGRGAPKFVPPGFVPPPFVDLATGLHRNDLIDKSDGGARASVADARDRGKFVIVYLQGKRNVTWYVPEPLIHLVLYCSQL
ncbi:MAG: hypothetical protein JWQ02_1311 [Capsulimonas sp.]|nr:hypothetical protein [Capsulimonas sp.]